MIKRIIAFIIRYIRRQEAERKRQEQELLLWKRKEEDARLTALEKFRQEKAWAACGDTPQSRAICSAVLISSPPFQYVR